ncbi:Bromodomain-containing protein 7 [Sarcoptes scabiei]|nr:Bromodomain-containing protein 7 [Sarcoptes scabiei]
MKRKLKEKKIKHLIDTNQKDLNYDTTLLSIVYVFYLSLWLFQYCSSRFSIYLILFSSSDEGRRLETQKHDSTQICFIITPFVNVKKLVFLFGDRSVRIIESIFFLLQIFQPNTYLIVYSLPSSINVGAVFTHDRFDQEVAFKLAIKRINNDRIILPKTRLIPKIEHIQKHDSFHADKKVCGLLKTGVVAIFDPLEGLISRHLKSICDALDIPHLETRWDFSSKRDDLSVNLYPKPAVLSRAYVDIVKAWAWEQFAIIYEDNEGFIRLQDFFKEAESLNWRIKLHQFKPGKPYRETFWKVKNDGERNIILDVRNENIFRALKHILNLEKPKSPPSN